MWHGWLQLHFEADMKCMTSDCIKIIHGTFYFLHKDVRNNRSYEYQKSGKHAVISQHYKTTLGNIDSKCRAGVYSEWSQYIVVVCKKKRYVARLDL